MPRSNNSGKNNSRKKPIEQYEHKDEKRTNNPPAGLVTPESDPPAILADPCVTLAPAG